MHASLLLPSLVSTERPIEQTLLEVITARARLAGAGGGRGGDGVQAVPL